MEAWKDTILFFAKSQLQNGTVAKYNCVFFSTCINKKQEKNVT